MLLSQYIVRFLPKSFSHKLSIKLTFSDRVKYFFSKKNLKIIMYGFPFIVTPNFLYYLFFSNFITFWSVSSSVLFLYTLYGCLVFNLLICHYQKIKFFSTDNLCFLLYSFLVLYLARNIFVYSISISTILVTFIPCFFSQNLSFTSTEFFYTKHLNFFTDTIVKIPRNITKFIFNLPILNKFKINILFNNNPVTYCSSSSLVKFKLCNIFNKPFVIKIFNKSQITHFNFIPKFKFEKPSILELVQYLENSKSTCFTHTCFETPFSFEIGKVTLVYCSILNTVDFNYIYIGSIQKCAAPYIFPHKEIYFNNLENIKMLSKISKYSSEMPSSPNIGIGMDIRHLTNLQVYTNRVNVMDINNLLNHGPTHGPTHVPVPASLPPVPAPLTTAEPNRSPIVTNPTPITTAEPIWTPLVINPSPITTAGPIWTPFVPTSLHAAEPVLTTTDLSVDSFFSHYFTIDAQGKYLFRDPDGAAERGYLCPRTNKPQYLKVSHNYAFGLSLGLDHHKERFMRSNQYKGKRLLISPAEYSTKDINFMKQVVFYHEINKQSDKLYNTEKLRYCLKHMD